MSPLRQKWGSLVCPGCGTLVGVQDERCLTCGRWNPGLWGFGPVLTRLGRDMGFVPFVMWGCAALYAATLLADPQGMRMGGLMNFLSPSTESLFIFGASGAYPVIGYGRWWTVLSAGWLHAGLLHIGMNMLWVRNVGPSVAEFYGASRMIIIYTVSGVTGFLASTYGSAYIFGRPGITVGASAAIFGLIGALIFYGRRTGSSVVSEQAKGWAISLAIIGFIIPGVDNWAHMGGLAGGYMTSKILDPLHPERLDHFLIAILCLVLTLVSIIVSVMGGLSLLRT